MSFTPLDHPGAWRGEELLGRRDWEIRLSDAELRELDDPSDAGVLLQRRTLAIQHALEHGSGACLIKGIGPRPESEARTGFQRICRGIGTPLSQDAEGNEIFSVRDAGFSENDPRARGPNTKKKLSFHTDRCDVIAFWCLQPARSGGENEVLSSMTLYNEIGRRRPDLLEVLMQPFPYKRHSVDTANPQAWCRQPIFSFREGHFACAFLRVLIERAAADPDIPDLSAPQREALDFLEAVAAEPELHVRFRQEAGDLLLLNNWVTLHRRSAFEDAREEALRRHILRIWLAVPNSRPLDPLFADNYGAVEPGAIRGGMRPQQP